MLGAVPLIHILVQGPDLFQQSTAPIHDARIRKGGSWRPKMEYPPLTLTYVSGPAYSFGIQEHVINGVAVKIDSPAKTVADCFKFLNKVGLDVALEALREAWRSRKVTMDELVEAAGIDRVSKIMRPYLEATVRTRTRKPLPIQSFSSF